MKTKDEMVWELTLMYLQKIPKPALDPHELRAVFDMANLVAYEYTCWATGD